MSLLAFLQGVALTEHRVANIFKPLASPSEFISNLSFLVLGITAGIFVVVAGLLAYAIWRFRSKSTGDYQEPAQIYGSNQIEIAWTVIPVLIVFTLTGITARVVSGVQDAKQPGSALQATVVGHQWWWEIHYPQLGITTANELHVPVADGPSKRPTFLRLESVDVVHSFWVPQLAGKVDVIPNRVNEMWMDPREPGVYFGNCAEYCGTQHANMLLRVIVHTPDDFQKWVEEQKKPAVQDPQVASQQAMFESLSCVNCHVVRGTSATGKFGPDLTHLMSRQTIGSGVVDNTPANLRAWVDDPQNVKPGCLMPSMKLTEKELDQVVAYLETLK